MRLGLLLVAACAHSTTVVAPPAPAFADADRVAKLATAFPAIGAMLDEQQAAQHIPELAFGVVIDGRLAFAHGDPDEVFRIGSMTKTFTATAVVMLRDAGVLRLDDPLAQWIPQAPHGPTLRDVLQHTSGLPPVGGFPFTRTDRAVTDDELVGGLSAIALRTPPGEAYAYSNLGYALLGRVVERASGVRYRDYVRTHVLDPLGMRASAFDPPAHHLARASVPPWQLGAAEASGGLYSTVSDLAKYVAWQLSAYPAGSRTLREMHRASFSTGLTKTGRAEGIGLGWWSYRSCALEQVVRHTGGADSYRGEIVMLPQRGVGLIVLTDNVDSKTGVIMDNAIDLLAKTGGFQPRVLPLSPSLARAGSALAALVASFTPAAYEQLFAKEFRAAVSPDQASGLAASLRETNGACQPPRPLRVDSAVDATLWSACERGHITYKLTLDGAGQIIAANATSHEEAAPVVDNCAPTTSM